MEISNDKTNHCLIFSKCFFGYGILSQFENESLYVKVGMELYYQAGAPFLQELKAVGHEIFLDLKLQDIPNTVYSAMKILKV